MCKFLGDQSVMSEIVKLNGDSDYVRAAKRNKEVPGKKAQSTFGTFTNVPRSQLNRPLRGGRIDKTFDDDEPGQRFMESLHS